MNWYLEVLKKYAVFEGRARRKEYWYFLLFNIIIGIILAVIDFMTGTFNEKIGMGLLGVIYILAVLMPGIAVAVRRLHDTNRSGWWLFIALVPLISALMLPVFKVQGSVWFLLIALFQFLGAIVVLIFMVKDSQSGENQYGLNPKTDILRSNLNGTKVVPSSQRTARAVVLVTSLASFIGLICLLIFISMIIALTERDMEHTASSAVILLFFSSFLYLCIAWIRKNYPVNKKKLIRH